MTQHITTLLQKEMTRKEFMATMGFGVASVLGFSSVIGLMTGKSFPGVSNHASITTNHGYGSSAYGGYKEVKTAATALR